MPTLCTCLYPLIEDIKGIVHIPLLSPFIKWWSWYFETFYRCTLRGFPGSASGKESTCQCRRCKRCRFDLCVGKIPWRQKLQPTPVFLPGEFQGQRNLEGYSPGGHKRIGRDWACMHWLSVQDLSSHLSSQPSFLEKTHPSFCLQRLLEQLPGVWVTFPLASIG